jgi:uncharacterized protein YndB with AHSA1/START domain
VGRTQPTPAANFSGEIACKVIEVVGGERLTISWTDAHTGQPAGWLVSWTLHAEGSGTRVILRHSGFDLDDDVQRGARTVMGNGWARIADRLGMVLND